MVISSTFLVLMQMAEIKTEIVQCGSKEIKWGEIISEGLGIRFLW